MSQLEISVARVASRQHGLVHRDQALALGMSARQLRARAASGLLTRVQPQVFRVASAPPSWDQRVLAACLSAGPPSAASHRCAALLWGLRGIEAAPVEVTVPPSRRPRLTDVVLHRSPVAAVTTCRGVPVTTPEATLLSLGSVVDEATLDSAVEDAVLRRLTTVDRLEETVARLGRQGRDGTAPLRRALDRRGLGAAATESVLEDMMLRLLRRAGMPPPRRQHRVAGTRLDFAYPERKLGIEVHGAKFHSSAADLQRDCARMNRLTAAGWQVFQFTWADLQLRAEEVARQLRVAA